LRGAGLDVRSTCNEEAVRDRSLLDGRVCRIGFINARESFEAFPGRRHCKKARLQRHLEELSRRGHRKDAEMDKHDV
jgi:hypothetical protein